MFKWILCKTLPPDSANAIFSVSFFTHFFPCPLRCFKGLFWGFCHLGLPGFLAPNNFDCQQKSLPLKLAICTRLKVKWNNFFCTFSKCNMTV